MKYPQYKLMTEHTDLDLDLYRALIKDAASNGNDRLNVILEVFVSLNVPADYQGDVEDIWNEGLAEIEKGSYAEDMAAYARMIWSLPPDLSDSLYNTLVQLADV